MPAMPKFALPHCRMSAVAAGREHGNRLLGLCFFIASSLHGELALCLASATNPLTPV